MLQSTSGWRKPCYRKTLILLTAVLPESAARFFLGSDLSPQCHISSPPRAETLEAGTLEGTGSGGPRHCKHKPITFGRSSPFLVKNTPFWWGRPSASQNATKVEQRQPRDDFRDGGWGSSPWTWKARSGIRMQACRS